MLYISWSFEIVSLVFVCLPEEDTTVVPLVNSRNSVVANSDISKIKQWRQSLSYIAV